MPSLEKKPVTTADGKSVVHVIFVDQNGGRADVDLLKKTGNQTEREVILGMAAIALGSTPEDVFLDILAGKPVTWTESTQ